MCHNPYNNLNKPLPKTTNILCHWCKHSCNYSPLGCPIKYSKQPKPHYTVDGIFVHLTVVCHIYKIIIINQYMIIV